MARGPPPKPKRPYVSIPADKFEKAKALVAGGMKIKAAAKNVRIASDTALRQRLHNLKKREKKAAADAAATAEAQVAALRAAEPIYLIRPAEPIHNTEAMASTEATHEPVTLKGACHCGAVAFAFEAPRDLVAIDCNCSICKMKKNTHTIVPQARFRLLQGQDAITTYTFNTHRAKHQFCKICGVQPFYTPRSNPDGVAITVACVDPATLNSATVETFDGENWESAYAASDIAEHFRVD
ncbi:hypothetical protein Gpo141_00007921 [Globisporangium polare]